MGKNTPGGDRVLWFADSDLLTLRVFAARNGATGRYVLLHLVSQARLTADDYIAKPSDARHRHTFKSAEFALLPHAHIEQVTNERNVWKQDVLSALIHKALGPTPPKPLAASDADWLWYGQMQLSGRYPEPTFEEFLRGVKR